MRIKLPRLFYYEETTNNWTPVPNRVENILCTSAFFDDGEIIEVQFKRIDMTDEDFDTLPDAG